VTAIVERLGDRFESEQQRLLSGQTEPGAFARAYLTTRAEPLPPQEAPIHTALLAAAGTDPQYLDPVRQRFADWQARLESDGIDPASASIVRLAIDGLCLCTLLGIPVPQGELRASVLEKLTAMTRQERE
jgi:hypothetical protein